MSTKNEPVQSKISIFFSLFQFLSGGKEHSKNYSTAFHLMDALQNMPPEETMVKESQRGIIHEHGQTRMAEDTY